MTTAYTSLLGLALPVTGELSGTWGDTVNNSITSLLDSAIAGTTTLSTDADVTLTTTTGAANTAREAILLCSGARTGIKTITAPAQSKIYTIINSTTGGYAVKIVGVGPTTGLTIPNGSSAVVAWNGSDFIEIGSSTVGNFTVNGNLTVTGTSALNGITTLGAALVGPASATVFNTVSTTVNAFGAATTLNIGAATGTMTVANATLTAKAITAAGVITNNFPSSSGNIVALNNTAAESFVISGDSGGIFLGTTAASTHTSLRIIAADTAIGTFATTGFSVTGTLTATGAGSIQGLTVGLGAGAVASNTAFGVSALAANTTGASNAGLGYQALYSNTTGNNNNAVGYQAGYSNTTGIRNSYLGYQAGYSNTTGDSNTAVGRFALYTNTATANTAFGNAALYLNTTGSNNLAVGSTALQNNTFGSSNTAIGQLALFTNTTSSNNTAVGYQAGYSNTIGLYLTAVGNQALYSNTTGGNNTAVGLSALLNNTFGGNNTAMGMQALNSNTTASGNTAVGYQAGYSNTFGADNTFVGNKAAYSLTTGSGNTIIGAGSGYSLTAGIGNTFIGPSITGIYPAGYFVTTGSKNVIIGSYSGSAAPISATGSNYIVLSDGDGNVRQTIDSSGNVGIGVTSPYANSKLDIQISTSANNYAFQARTLASGSGDGTTTARVFRIVNADNTNWANAQYDAYSHIWTSATTEKMRLDASGNLGIGTTSPNSRLQVSNSTASTNAIAQFTNGTTGTAAANGLYVGIDSSNEATVFNFYNSVLKFGTNATEKMRIDIAGNAQFRAGAVMPYAPAPAAISAATTLTNANIQAQIINTTGTTYTVTMPLGTTMETLATWATTNIAYDFYVINTASGTVTMAVNTGVTSLGTLTIATGVSAQFRIRRTAANTFVLYRLG